MKQHEAEQAGYFAAHRGAARVPDQDQAFCDIVTEAQKQGIRGFSNPMSKVWFRGYDRCMLERVARAACPSSLDGIFLAQWNSRGV